MFYDPQNIPIQVCDYLKTWFCKASMYKIWTKVAAFIVEKQKKHGLTPTARTVSVAKISC